MFTDLPNHFPLWAMFRLSCFYCFWIPRPLNNLQGVIDYTSFYTGNNLNNCVDEWLPGDICDFNTDYPCVFHAVDLQISFSHILKSVGNAWEQFIGRRPLFVPDHVIIISVRELSVSQTGLYQKCLDFLLDSSVSIRRFNNWEKNSPRLL